MRLKILGPAPTARRLVALSRYLKNRLYQIKPEKSQFRFAVAYAHESYEQVLGKTLRNYVKRGGTIEAVVGVDSRGTSAKALKELINICGPSNVFVYHNPADGTFHPKLYMLSEDKVATIIIGSSNLTLGGFANNFEVNVAIDLNLESPKDKAFFNMCVRLFEEIKGSRSSRLLNSSLLQELKSIGVLRGRATLILESALSTVRRNKLREHFGSTPQRGIRVRARKMRKYPRFVMSLTGHDVSAKRGEPYFLIPIKARDENPEFWGWKSLFAPSPRGKFPQRLFKAEVTIGKKRTLEDCRLYFFEGRDEFRFKCKLVHELGQGYVKSFVVISWKRKRGQRFAVIGIIPPNDQKYERLAKLPFEMHAMGKKWVYR